MGLIIASSCGLWNTCYCWGGAFVHGEKTQIQMNSTSVFNYNDGTEYPAIVGTCLGTQVLVFVIMFLVGCQGFKSSLWCEREKSELRAAVDLSRSHFPRDDRIERGGVESNS